MSNLFNPSLLAERDTVGELVVLPVEGHLVALIPDGYAVRTRKRDPTKAETVRTLVVDHVVGGATAGVDRDAAAIAAGHVLESDHKTVVLVLGPAPTDRRRNDVAIFVLVLANAPAWTKVLAGMITVESEDERLR